MQDSSVQVYFAMLVEMRITKSSWILTRGDICRRSDHAHDDDCHQICSFFDDVYPQVRCADDDVGHGRDEGGPWTHCAVEDVGPRSQRTWHLLHWTQMTSPVDQCANQLGKSLEPVVPEYSCHWLESAVEKIIDYAYCSMNRPGWSRVAT